MLIEPSPFLSARGGQVCLAPENEGAGGAPPTEPVPSQTPAPAAFDWKGALGESYTSAEPVITAKGWKGPADLIQGYTALEQSAAGRVAIPGEGAKPEDIAAFHKALGVPDSAEGYKLDRPEGMPDEAWNEGNLTELRKVGHQLGLTPAQVSGIAAHFAGTIQTQLQEAAAAAAAEPARIEAELRKEFGANAPRAKELAKRAAQKFGDEETVFALESQIGGAALVKMFARIGEQMGEGTLVGAAESAFGVTTPAAAKAKLAEKGRDPEWMKAVHDSDHPAHAQSLAEWQELQVLAASKK